MLILIPFWNFPIFLQVSGIRCFNVDWIQRVSREVSWYLKNPYLESAVKDLFTSINMRVLTSPEISVDF